jgi:MFS family permease
VAVGESVRPLGAVFANPSLRRLQLANASSVIGGWAYVVALAVFAYAEDGAYAVGLLATARWLCGGLAAPIGGIVGDRYPRVRVMIASDLVRAVVLASMGLASFTGAPPFAVYGLALLATLSATPFGPAQAALLPQLARSPGELTAANASTGAVDNVGSFVGPALGGLVVAVANVGHREQMERGDGGDAGGGLRGAFAGFGALARTPRLRLVVGLVAAQTVVDGALDVLIVVLALETLEAGASGLGFLNSAAGVGGVVAALAAGGFAARGRLASSLGVGITLWGLPLILIGVWPEQAVALVLLAVVGAGGTIAAVAGDTLLQRAAPPDLLARVFGAVDGILLVALAVGSLAAPLLISTIGVRGALVVAGALLPVLAAVTWTRLVAVDAAAAARVRELELLQRSPIFTPLPPATLEALAARLEPRRVEAGAIVFSQGDAGDDFYLVDSGRVSVAVDGSVVAELGPGETFGEIALLRAVPRTATVTALTNVTLQAVDREQFLGAVTGHAQSRAAAESLVVARLSPAAL